MSTSIEALKRISQKSRTVDVEVDGETITLTRPSAVDYQKLMNETQKSGHESNSHKLFSFVVMCLQACIPGLGKPDAEEFIVSIGGIQADDFMRSLFEICGLNLDDMNQSVKDGDLGNS